MAPSTSPARHADGSKATKLSTVHSPLTAVVPLENRGTRGSTHPSPDYFNSHSPSHSSPHPHPQLQLQIATTTSQPHPHPLAQTPVTASNPTLPSPLPIVGLSAPNVASLRSYLTHRRSSFPPATSSGTPGANAFPWTMGGTPTGGMFDFGAVAADPLASFGAELGMEAAGRSGFTPGGLWDSLLNFDTDGRSTPVKAGPEGQGKQSAANPDDPFTAVPMTRAKSDSSNQPQLPLSFSTSAMPNFAASSSGPSSHTHAMAGRVAQMGSEMVYKTMLGSIVEIEGVGQVNAARVLMEVWKRGGGDVVTTQCLWPSIIMSLAFATDQGPGMRIPTPSSQAAVALQNLYNLTLRPCEPSIFSGLLSNYLDTMTPGAPRSSNPLSGPAVIQANPHHSHLNLLQSHQSPTHQHHSQPQSPQQPVANAFAAGAQVYGASTPTKNVTEQELAQWTTLTPGAEWSEVPTLAGTYTPRGSISSSGPSALSHALDAGDVSGSSSRPGSRGDDGIKELNDLLAQMEEERNEEARREAARETTDSTPVGMSPNTGEKGKEGTVGSQLPTPPTTDSSMSPADGIPNLKRKASAGEASDVVPLASASSVTPVSMASPFVTANSVHSTSSMQTSFSSASSVSAIVPSSSTGPTGPTGQGATAAPTMFAGGGKGRAPPPTQLALPTTQFIPPPPMCMFFSPSFRDLQQGKVAIWKGDIEVRGRGGGTFSILIVGEEGSGNLWQSHTWPERLVYPPAHVPVESCTSTMLPVSMLAREGLLPVAMGMVLCNDANISNYVRMVQGLHAEGVAFHLPLPGLPLPIIVLPAKFDSNDPLQRLGIAFMSKGGAPPPNPTTAASIPATMKSTTASGRLDKEKNGKDGKGDVPAPANGDRKKRRKTGTVVPESDTAMATTTTTAGTGAAGEKKTSRRRSNTSRSKIEVTQ